MAPEVAVPANFGKHHLKSRTHNNLELLCAKGEVQRANSMILSLNSSVIEDLIARLEITSLDMQDFAAPAVNCFVESMYSGELENCDKTNFRDLNKMGHAFDVTWFVERCLKYFTELVDLVTGRCYEDILFVAEEAWFVGENLKKDNFLELVMRKLDEIGNKKSVFLKRYTSDLDTISLNQIKMVVKIAENDVGILASILGKHLEKNSASSLTKTTRYLFENIDFVECFSNRRYCDITGSLISKILNDSSSEDFKSAVKCISRLAHPKNSEAKNNLTCINQYPVMLEMTLEKFLKLDWDSLCKLLSQSDKIDNLCNFFDAIFLWLHMERLDGSQNVPRIDFSDQTYIEDIIDIKIDRCWDQISQKYLKSISPDENLLGIDYLVESLTNSYELSFDNGAIFISDESYSIERLCSAGNRTIQLTLPNSDDKVPGCSENSKCGIMLKLSCEKDKESIDSFSLDFVKENLNDENTEIHHHISCDSSQIVSLMMEVDDSTVTPIPFNALPNTSTDGSWFWGFHEFTADGKRSSTSESPCHYSFAHKGDDPIRLMACLTF